MCDKPKLTPEMHEHITSAIASAALSQHAAQSVGISYKTFIRWMARGKLRKDAEHSRFYRAVVQERSKIFCQSSLVLLRKLNKGDYRAAAFMIKLLLDDDYEAKIAAHLARAKNNKSEDEDEDEDAL